MVKIVSKFIVKSLMNYTFLFPSIFRLFAFPQMDLNSTINSTNTTNFTTTLVETSNYTTLVEPATKIAGLGWGLFLALLLVLAFFITSLVFCRSQYFRYTCKFSYSKFNCNNRGSSMLNYHSRFAVFPQAAGWK